MPLNAQPPGRRGTVGHPYTPLTLRLVLAAFGLVLCAGFAVFLVTAGHAVPGAVFALFAAVAAVDLVVIGLRRRAARRQ
ncbi:hypothetical protein [Cryptosporangium japonicum]